LDITAAVGPQLVPDLRPVWSKAISAKGTMVKRMNEMGAVATPGSAAGFGNFVETETVMWTKVIKAANIQAG
jgi:hypothetical protein